MKGVSIFKARHHDVPHITRLLRQLFHYKKVKLCHVKESLADKMVFVARYRKKVVGLISMSFLFKKKIAYIKEVIVDKRFRGKKIGDKLLKRAISDAKKNSAKFIFLVSALKRTGAHAFYLKNNFKRIIFFTGFFYRKVDG
jgi:N-acetylglutamate synthase-like GNAT family acetyltransferase